MTIPSAAKPTPIDAPNANVAAVDPRTGLYSMAELQRQSKVRNYVVGMGRIIPCSASGTNFITLTPNGSGGQDGEGPLLEGLKFGDAFLFYAESNSSGPVTATVVPKTGNLATLPVYVGNGATQADSGDVVEDSVYFAVFAPHLNGGDGGFVLK